jgi:hypothetical protein
MKYLFLDSNIWLSLYHFSSDDLEQFAKLKDLLKSKDIILMIPRQVHDEVWRNRDNKLFDCMKEFNQIKFNLPVFCKNYTEYPEFDKKLSDLNKLISAWKNKIEGDINELTLPADVVIRSFFTEENLIPCTEFVAEAQVRFTLGNPPGKDGKFGDAINWTCLLKKIPVEQDLYFVSADKDYVSPFAKDKFSVFLRREWETSKKSKIHFFKNLQSFVSAHVKEIKLRQEEEKNSIIRSLAASRSYSSSHVIIEKLSKIASWSDDQVDEICSIVWENSQVGDIFEDDDIIAFYRKLVSKCPAKTEAIDAVRKKIEANSDDDEIDLS